MAASKPSTTRSKPSTTRSKPNTVYGGLAPAFCGAVLRFLWICYKHGLEDAARSGDVGECQEAATRLKDIRSFGTIDFDMDWTEWQFKTLQWTRDDICRLRVMDLIMAMRKPSHKFGFVMQLAKMHYIRGLMDWIECCDWLTLEMVKLMPSYPYLTKRAHSFRNSSLGERFEALQQECINLARIHETERNDETYYLPATRLRMFVERVWAAMQRPRWFDDYDVETDGWKYDDDDVDLDKVTESDYYSEQFGVKPPKKRNNNDDKTHRQGADRRVSRKDARRGDAPADGVVLQSGAAKRCRGRPPKNV